MIIRHGFRRNPSMRPARPGRAGEPIAPGTDIILVMMAIMLLFACIFKILQG